MKRSEMLNILKETFRKYDTVDSIAERALSAVEDAGMLPPQRNADMKSSYGYAQVWEWEKENEETK